MDEAQVVSSEVEVAVEPNVAFEAFTDEMDLWWVRGPINFGVDGGRVVEVRCEGRVGGRIGPVLDDPILGELAAGARITVWEPGVRLAWESTGDDVVTEVRFEPTALGTRVVVQQTIRAGGVDRGGTAWSRVVPPWFGAWCAKRDHVPHVQRDIARVALQVHYARPAAAARWLVDAFGFQALDPLPDQPDPLPHGEHGHPWIELHVAGNASLMVQPLDGSMTEPPGRLVPWLYVEDIDALLAQAEAAGARIVERRHDWLRLFGALDLEGNRWTFTQARPTQL